MSNLYQGVDWYVHRLNPDNGAMGGASYWQEEKLKDGTSIQEVINLMASSVVEFNARIRQNTPTNYLPRLMHITTEFEVYYTGGNAPVMEQSTELSLPRIFRTEQDGHWLPLNKYDKGLGWLITWLTERATLNLIINDIKMAVKAWDNTIHRNVLTTLTSNVPKNVGGLSGGKSLSLVNGNADGAGFIPMENNGLKFDETHDHFLVYDTTARAEAISVAVEHLVEHGHMGDFEMFIPQSDVSLYRALNDDTYGVYWHDITRGSVQFGVDISFATVGEPQDYIGVIRTNLGNILVRVNNRYPSTLTEQWTTIYKPGFADDMGNAVWWRINPDKGDIVTASNNLREGQMTWSPYTIVNGDSGIGMDRTAAVNIFFKDAAPSYVPPVIK